MLQRETFIVGSILAAFLAFNFATVERFPIPWMDEVMFMDPAVNLYLGYGFTSAAWFETRLGEFWAGYPPLYPLLLSGWLELVGFGVKEVRSLNLLLMAASALLFHVAIRRHGLIRRQSGRLAFLLLLLLGYSTTFCYRSGRVECVALFLLAALLLSASLQRARTRFAAMASTAALLPAAGLQYLPFAFVMTALVPVVSGAKYRRELFAAGAGLVAGCLGLIAFYAANGALEAFVRQTFGRKTILGRTLGEDGLTAALGSAWWDLGGLYRDPSYLVLLPVAVVLFVLHRRDRGRPATALLDFGLLAAIAVPAALYVTGVYPVYYAWMAFVPLALGVCAALAEWSPAPQRSRSLLGFGGVAAACAVGLPLVAGVASLEWTERDASVVERDLHRLVHPTDTVLADYSAYYVLKGRVESLYLPPGLYRLAEDDREKFTALVIQPGQLRMVAGLLGGTAEDWTKVADARGSARGSAQGLSIWGSLYRLSVFRRQEAGSPNRSG